MNTDRWLKKALLFILKLAVVAVCFGLILTRLNVADIPAHLSSAYLPLVALALLTVLAETLVMAAKWNILLKQKNLETSYLTMVRVLFSSNFLGVAVPNSVGLDAIRIYMLKQKNNDYVHTTGTLVADRLMAVVVLALLSLMAVPVVVPAMGTPRVAGSIVAMCLAVLGGSAFVVSGFAGRWFARISGVCLDGMKGGEGSRSGGLWVGMHGLLERAASFLSQVHDSVRSLVQGPHRVLLAVFFLNVGLQLLRVVQVHCLFRSIGVTVPVMQELAFVPVIVMLSLLPISFFGLGIKEGAFVFFFSQVHVAASAALTVSLISYPLIFLALLPGGLFLLVDRSGSAPKNEGGANS